MALFLQRPWSPLGRQNEHFAWLWRLAQGSGSPLRWTLQQQPFRPQGGGGGCLGSGLGAQASVTSFPTTLEPWQVLQLFVVGDFWTCSCHARGAPSGGKMSISNRVRMNIPSSDPVVLRGSTGIFIPTGLATYSAPVTRPSATISASPAVGQSSSDLRLRPHDGSTARGRLFRRN